MKWFRWWWLLLLIPIALGLARLHFDVEMLDLLPANVPAVAGPQNLPAAFRQRPRTHRHRPGAKCLNAAESVGAVHRGKIARGNQLWSPTPPGSRRGSSIPEQTAELIAYLWLNQPPEKFDQSRRAAFAETNLANVLAATRDQLATTLSPNEIAQLGYDPFGLTRLPENVAGTVSGFGSEEQELFASADGTFRIIFVKARGELSGYRECADWFNAVKQIVASTFAGDKSNPNRLHRPARFRRGNFRQHEARHHAVRRRHVGHHRDFVLARAPAHGKPMLWLLTLLALILAATLALGGLIFGVINVISMGFAAILLGLAVDYAVVHYQEALAHPELTMPEVRRAIAPAIFWAAVTTISARFSF